MIILPDNRCQARMSTYVCIRALNSATHLNISNGRGSIALGGGQKTGGGGQIAVAACATLIAGEFTPLRLHVCAKFMQTK